MRLIQIQNGILALPEYGDPRFCKAYDEDCDGLDHAHCFSGPVFIIDKVYARCPPENPCPYLD